MNQLRLLAGLLAIAASLLASSTTFAASNSQVSYTWNLAALGQGGWVGGPLFADGTVGGGGTISVNNGQVVERIQPTTWTEPVEDTVVICFVVSTIKPAGGPSTTLCIPAPVTGTPITVTLFGAEHILRVTEVR